MSDASAISASKPRRHRTLCGLPTGEFGPLTLAMLFLVLFSTRLEGAGLWPYEQPFPEPWYVVHINGTHTMGGYVEADVYIFSRLPPENNTIITGDGTGGTYTNTTDNHWGPFDSPIDVCASIGNEVEMITTAGGNTWVACAGYAAEQGQVKQNEPSGVGAIVYGLVALAVLASLGFGVYVFRAAIGRIGTAAWLRLTGAGTTATLLNPSIKEFVQKSLSSLTQNGQIMAMRLQELQKSTGWDKLDPAKRLEQAAKVLQRSANTIIQQIRTGIGRLPRSIDEIDEVFTELLDAVDDAVRPELQKLVGSPETRQVFEKALKVLQDEAKKGKP